MSALETAIREALAADEQRAPDAPLTWEPHASIPGAPRRPARGWLLAAASLIVIGGLAAMALFSGGSADSTVAGVSSPTTDRAQAEHDRAQEELRRREAAVSAAKAAALARAHKAAEQRVTREVATALADVGWSVQVQTDVLSRSVELDGALQLVSAEVRLRDGDGAELVVVIHADEAAAPETTVVHGRQLPSSGAASVYVVTDDSGARAVQLVDGATTIDVRSTSSTGPTRSLSDLAAFAQALDRARD